VRARTEAEIIRKTTQETPPQATQWSTRTMAQAVGISKATVQRVRRDNGLQPHRTKTFKVSNDPKFTEKLVDVVGLYLNPPEHALVLSCDEKSQIQALDRTQKSLPMFPGRLKTLTHDYKRNGTTTLFAAIELADGKIIAECMPRHRHQEWIKFLKRIDAETPPDLDLHLIVDNYATHKHPKVKTWLKRHKRFHLHFIPTSSSWLNVIERWFRDITHNRIRKEGVFKSVTHLEAAIHEYINHHNANPKSFVWTKKAKDILEKVARARASLDKIPSV
jgi:transposase